jgi:hypothetical protein
MDTLPMFRYNEPKGSINAGARTTQVKFYPQGFASFGGGVAPGNYVKFDFRTTGFWDPKSSYIQIEVQPDTFDPALYTDLFQVDNSAQSIFSQFIVRHQGVELERCNDYDSLCAMLYDMNVGLGARDYQDLQGMGKNRSGFPGTMSNRGTASYNIELNHTATADPTTSNVITNSVGTSKYFVSVGTDSKPIPTNMNVAPLYSRWRPYLSAINSCTDNALGTEGASLTTTSQLQSYLMLFMLEGNEGLQTAIVGDVENGMTYDGAMSLDVANYGYTHAYSEACVGTGEPYMTNGTIPRITIASGTGVWKNPKVLTFVLPLMSPIWGPNSTHGKLLPMRLFQGLEFEFQISPYLFTVNRQLNTALKTTKTYATGTIAGFADNTKTLAGEMGDRNGWRIKNMTIVTEIINLEEEAEMKVIDRIERGGFNLPFEQWYLCSKIKYSDTQQLNTSIQVNHGFDSLKMISLRAQPADFEKYSWARKHQYISMNLTSLQIRVGNEYIPSTPITGHCGNIRSDLDSGIPKGNYSEFLIQTTKAWGKFFNMNDSTLLNPTNYTMNCTPYYIDPLANLSTPTQIIPSGPYTTKMTGLQATVRNLLMNQGLFHSNRAVARNIISLDTERFDLETRVRSGINTTLSRPWDLLLQNDSSPLSYFNGPIGNPNADANPTNKSGYVTSTAGTAPVSIDNTSFNRPFYLYIWAFYDSSLTFINGEWGVQGRR